MSTDNYAKYAGKGFQVASIVLTILFWVAFTIMLRGHMPFPDPMWVNIGSAFTALSVSGVFYFATHMFWMVLQDYRAHQAK
jgi:hypothetical protein